MRLGRSPLLLIVLLSGCSEGKDGPPASAVDGAAPNAEAGYGTPTEEAGMADSHDAARDAQRSDDCGLSVDADGGCSNSDARLTLDAGAADAGATGDAGTDAGGERCFSPIGDTDPGDSGVGCACDDTLINRMGTCEKWGALICQHGRWISVNDGPCWPPRIISEPYCVARGGEAYPAGARTRDPMQGGTFACPDGGMVIGTILRAGLNDAGVEDIVAYTPCCK